MYLKSSHKYEILTGPGESASACEFSSDNDPDVIDVKKLQKAIEESFKDMGEQGLAKYISKSNRIDRAVSILPPVPCDRNGRPLSGETPDPFLLWTVYTDGQLDRSEEKNLLDYITGQCSDGWGEEFEQFPIYKYSGIWEDEWEEEDPDTGEWDSGTEEFSATYEIYYSPWQYRIWDIKILTQGIVREKKEAEFIEIQEEVKIVQEDLELILEKGDRIEVLKERKVPISWEAHEDIAIELFSIMEEAGMDVYFDDSDYSRGRAIQFRLFNKTFELDLNEIDR
jgi:hypothetical protein